MPRRGGLGVRHAQAEAIEKATKYRLVGVRPGSSVAECLDKYGRWEGGYRIGVILRNSVTSVTVQWEGDEEFTYYNAGDARYKVDRNLWRITPPKPQNIFEAIESPALTRNARSGSIAASPHPRSDALTEEDAVTSRKRSRVGKQATVQKDEGGPKIVPDEDPIADTGLADDPAQGVPAEDEDEAVEMDDTLGPDAEEAARAEAESDDEVDDTKIVEDGAELFEGEEADDEIESDLPERETYTAKQVATRIGTDAKTLRKFFRSSASTVEPVGQGGRYEFAAEDMKKIRDEFTKWNNNKTPRGQKGLPKVGKKGRQAPAAAEVIEEDDSVLELDDEEPTDDELEEIDDELDD